MILIDMYILHVINIFTETRTPPLFVGQGLRTTFRPTKPKDLPILTVSYSFPLLFIPETSTIIAAACIVVSRIWLLQKVPLAVWSHRIFCWFVNAQIYEGSPIGLPQPKDQLIFLTLEEDMENVSGLKNAEATNWVPEFHGCLKAASRKKTITLILMLLLFMLLSASCWPSFTIS